MSQTDKVVAIDANGIQLPDKPVLQFDIVNQTSKSYRKFNRIEHKTSFNIVHNLSEFASLVNIQDDIETGFERVISGMMKDAASEDLISVNINNDNLSTDIFISPEKVKDFKFSNILTRIHIVAQSNRAFLLDGELTIQVYITKSINGSGRAKGSKAPKSTLEISKSKLSVVQIKNNDYSCGYLPTYIALYPHE